MMSYAFIQTTKQISIEVYSIEQSRPQPQF